MAEQLEYDIILSTLGLDKGVNEVENTIKKLLASTEKTTLQMASGFDTLFKKIEEKKRIIQSLEDEIEGLENGLRKIKTPDGIKNYKEMLSSARDELIKSVKDLATMEAQSAKVVKTFEQMNAMYERNVALMEKMRTSGMEQTKEYQDLFNATERLKENYDAMITGGQKENDSTVGLKAQNAQLNETTEATKRATSAINEQNKAVSQISTAIKSKEKSELSSVQVAEKELTATKAKLVELKKLVAEQKEFVKGLEKENKENAKSYEKMAPGTAKIKAGNEIQDNEAIYKKEVSYLHDLEAEHANVSQEVQKATQTYKNCKNEEIEANKRVSTSLRDVKDAMEKLRMDGKTNTEEYKKLEEQATEMSKAKKAVAETLNTSASKTEYFQGVMSGITGLSGAFSAGMGVMSLFGVENEKLAVIQDRLQAVMGVTIGLQAVANTLSATSAFRTALVTKATAAWSAGQMFLNTQLGISVGLSRALMATGVGAVLALVGAAVWGLSQAFSSANDEGEKLSQTQKDYNEAITSFSSETKRQAGHLRELERVASDANKPLEERKKALDELNQIMPEYNGYLDAESGALIRNKDAMMEYIRALSRLDAVKKLEEKQIDRTLKIAALEEQNKRLLSGERNATTVNGERIKLNKIPTIEDVTTVDQKSGNVIIGDLKTAQNRVKVENKNKQKAFNNKAIEANLAQIKELKEQTKETQELQDKLLKGTEILTTSTKTTPENKTIQTAQQQIDEAKRYFDELERLYPTQMERMLINNKYSAGSFAQYLQKNIEKGGEDTIYFKAALRDATKEDIEKAEKIYADIDTNGKYYSESKKNQVYKKMGASSYEDFLKKEKRYAIQNYGNDSVQAEVYSNALEKHAMEETEKMLKKLIELREKYKTLS
nr:hypothetical protein [Flavobacteriales bacterium]